jgi:hypothetical protein
MNPTREVANKISEQTKVKFKQFMEILDLLDKRSNNDGVSKITQKEISEIIKTSPTNVSKKLNLLQKYGAIHKIGAGHYKLLHNDIMFTPYRNVVKVISLVVKEPSLIREYKVQSEILILDYWEVQQAWGFILNTENEEHLNQ